MRREGVWRGHRACDLKVVRLTRAKTEKQKKTEKSKAQQKDTGGRVAYMKVFVGVWVL